MNLRCCDCYMNSTGQYYRKYIEKSIENMDADDRM